MGYLPLVPAATADEEGYPQTVDLLLGYGADINATMKGRTALDWAAGFGKVAMVRHLLDRGAEPRPATLSIARSQAERHHHDRQRYEHVVAALRDAGATDGPGTRLGTDR